MRALHFAIATANLACQVAFLFLAAHSPMCIASSPASTLRLLQCGFQPSAYCLWNCSPHATARCEDDRDEVHNELLAYR